MLKLAFTRLSILLLIKFIGHGLPCSAAEEPTNSVDAAVIKEHIRAASRFSNQKKYEKAKKEYDFLIGNNPKDVELYISRGYVELSLKQFDAAIADAERVSALSKFRGHLYSAAKLHAKAAEGLNDSDAAIKQYLLASQRFSGNPDDQVELGKLYLQRKSYDEALVCLTKARDKYLLSKDNERVRKLAEDCQKLISRAQAKIAERQRIFKGKKVD